MYLKDQDPIFFYNLWQKVLLYILNSSIDFQIRTQRFIFGTKINQLQIGFLKTEPILLVTPSVQEDESTQHIRNLKKIIFEWSRYPLTFTMPLNLFTKYILLLFFERSWDLPLDYSSLSLQATVLDPMLIILGLGAWTLDRNSHTLKYFKLDFLPLHLSYGIDCVLNKQNCFLYKKTNLFVAPFCIKDSSSTKDLW